jgi:hypothetical protein
MLQSTPMLSQQDSADSRACQRVSTSPVWTRTETVDMQSLIAAVARAYTDVYDPVPAVTSGAILGPGRATHAAQARHLCAYLLAEDYHLTNAATAHALGRADHTTALNSRARIAAALPHDTRLARVLDRARADLAGHRRTDDEGLRVRRDEGRRRALAEVSPQDWDEYRYWRLRAGRAAMTGWEVRDGL